MSVLHIDSSFDSDYGGRDSERSLQGGSFRRQSLSGSDEFPYSQCGKLYRYRNVRCTVTDQTRKKTRNF